MAESLSIQGVYAAYKKKEIIRGVTLSLRPGQTMAVIGPNGAGKSTLLRIISGFLKPSRGYVLLNGVDIQELEPHQRARLGIGYLMQGGRVFSSLTIAENLELASSGSRRKKENTVREIAESLHLGSALNAKVGTLSGGWRQRLALAMVLARQPELLLLDEPVAGLSPQMMNRVFETLDKYQQTHNAAILLVEQNVEAVLEFAHRAVTLVNGRIVEQTKQPTRWLVEGELESLFWGEAWQTTSGDHEVTNR